MSKNLVKGLGAGTVVIPFVDSVSGHSANLTTRVHAAPTLTSVSPASEAQGASSQSIVFTGTGFDSLCSPIFSNVGVTVNSFTVDSATQITANISVGGGAGTGAGTALVRTTASPGADTGTAVFTVNASGGGTPAGAAVPTLYFLNNNAVGNPTASHSATLPLANHYGGLGWAALAAGPSPVFAGGVNPYVQTSAGGAPQSALYGGWVSEALSAQTVPGGTYTIKIGLYAESGSSYKLAPVAYIYRASNDSVVGYIYDSATGIGSATGSSGSTCGKVVTFTGASCAILDGDRLVVELYAVGTGSDFVHLVYNDNFTTTEGGTAGIGEIDFPSPIYLQPYGIIRVGPTGIRSSTGAIPTVNVTNDAGFRSLLLPSGGNLWDSSATSANGTASSSALTSLDHSSLGTQDLMAVDTSVQFTDRDSVTRNTLHMTIKPTGGAPLSSANDKIPGSSAVPQANWHLPPGRSITQWYVRRLFKFKGSVPSPFRLDCPNNTQSNTDLGSFTAASGTSTTVTFSGTPFTANALVGSLFDITSGTGHQTGSLTNTQRITANTNNTLTFTPYTGALTASPDSTSVCHIYGFNFNNSGAYKCGAHPSNDVTRADIEITGGQTQGSEYMTGNFGAFCTTDSNYIMGGMSTIMPNWNTNQDVWEIIRVMRDHGDGTATHAIYIGKVTDTTLTRVLSTTRTLDVTAQLANEFTSTWPAMNSVNITGKNFNRQLASTDVLPELWVSDTEIADITDPTFTWPAQIASGDRI